MINVIRINGAEMTLNAELIESIEATPDTMVTLTSGKKYILRDKVEDVVQKIIAYKKDVLTQVTVVDHK